MAIASGACASDGSDAPTDEVQAEQLSAERMHEMRQLAAAWDSRFKAAETANEQANAFLQYLNTTTPEITRDLVAATGLETFRTDRMRFMVGRVLNHLGRYEEAVAQYDAILDDRDSAIDSARVRYHKALNELEQPAQAGVLVPEHMRSALRTKLIDAEAKPNVGWTDELNYRIAFLSFSVGEYQDVLNRLGSRADRIREARSRSDRELDQLEYSVIALVETSEARLNN